MFSLRQYCLDFLIFTMKDSKFHFSPTFTSNLFFQIHFRPIYQFCKQIGKLSVQQWAFLGYAENLEMDNSLR